MKFFKDSSIPAFHQKICAIEARGKEIDSVMMVTPSIIEKYNEFSMGISILDKDKCPCFYEELILEVVEEGNEDNRFTVAFSTKEISVMKVKCTVGHTGFIKFYTHLNSKKYYSNPAYSTENKTVDMLWGGPHVHTTVGGLSSRKRVYKKFGIHSSKVCLPSPMISHC